MKVKRWSLDLISGLPGLTPALWRESLEEAVKAAPSHVSVYDLQVEEGTPFGRWYTPGEGPMPREEEAAEMFRTASEAGRGGGVAPAHTDEPNTSIVTPFLFTGTNAGFKYK